MRRSIRCVSSVVVKAVVGLAIVVIVHRWYEGDIKLDAVVRDVRPTSAVVTFERGDVSLEPHGSDALDALAERAMTNLSLRILIVGFANERGALQENLDLAERRARTVSTYLASRSVADYQIVVAAVEAAPSDAIGARCEVELFESHGRSPAAQRLLVPPPMPKLEARFHPWQSRNQAHIVVGHVVWDATSNQRPRVIPAASLWSAHAPSAILATLRYLVERSAASFERLANLQSRFWTFVPTDDPDEGSNSSSA